MPSQRQENTLPPIVTENCAVSQREVCGVPISGMYWIIILLTLALLSIYAMKSEKDTYGTLLCRYHPMFKPGQKNSGVYCPPTTNIFFLKTHKCASSTVQNIVMRFGDKKNLLFGLPKDSNYIGHPEKFSRTLVPQPHTHYNVLCHHLRLDVNKVRNVLPTDAVFITIVRDPLKLFQSMYDYYNMTNYTGVDVNDFVYNSAAMVKLTNERLYDRLGRNQMLFDMGYDLNLWENDTLIHRAIKEMDDFFNLVMVSEFFEESIILLKHKLCWSMEDIVYLVHNRRRLEPENAEDHNVTTKLREYNRADQILYDHFLAKLHKEIDEYGRERMAAEVKDLQIWNKLWFDHCVEKVASCSDKVPEQTKAYSTKVYSFVLRKEPIAKLCKELATQELQYTKKLRRKQVSNQPLFRQLRNS